MSISTKLTVNSRLLEVYEILKSRLRVRNKTEFARAAGFLNTHWSEYESEKRRFTHKHLLNLVNRFSDVSLKYLETGEGEPVSELMSGLDKSGQPSRDALALAKASGITPEKVIAHIAHILPSGVAIRPVSAVLIKALSTKGILTVSRIEQSDYVKRIVEEHAQSGLTAAVPIENTFVMFEVVGKSMAPVLDEGDWVVCARLASAADIKSNAVHVLIAHDSIYIKRVRKAVQTTKGLPSREAVILDSENGDYAPDVIAAEDILEVWALEAKLTSRV